MASILDIGKNFANPILKFLNEGAGRVGTAIKTNPLQFTPLSMRSQVVPMVQGLGKTLGINKNITDAASYGLRGALNLTPFQSPSNVPGLRSILPGQLNRQSQMLKSQESRFAPTTPFQSNAERIGRAAYGTILTAPLAAGKTAAMTAFNLTRNAGLGTGIGAGIGFVSPLFQGRLPNKKDISEGAMGGLENSWTLAFTNKFTDAILGKIAPKLVGEAITSPFKYGQVRQGLARVFSRAMSEVLPETTAFTFVDQLSDKDKREFAQAFMSNLPGNIISNLAFASGQSGFNILKNSQSRQAVASAIENAARPWMRQVTGKYDPRTGKREVMPLWQYKLKYPDFGMSIKDVNEGKTVQPPQSTVGGVGKKVFYSGSETPTPSGKYLYLTPDKNYAGEFGKNINEYQFQPKNAVDFSDLGEKPLTFKALQKRLADNGVKIDSSMVEENYRTGVSEPAWFWFRRYQNLPEEIQKAGKDSIILKESIGNAKSKVDSVIVLDKSIASPNVAPLTKPQSTVGGVKPQAATVQPVKAPQQSLVPVSSRNTLAKTAVPQPGELQTAKPGQLSQSPGGGTQPPKPPVTSNPLPSKVPESGGLINSVKSKVNNLYTQAVDRFHPLSQIAKKAGKDQVMQNALTGHYGAGSTSEYHIDYELAPILKEQPIDQVRQAAIAMRDVELANRGIKGSKQQKQALGNLKKLETELGAEKMAELGATLKKLYAYQDKMVRDYLVKNGIISEAAYSAMRQKNQFYVPYRRVMDTVDEFLGFTPQTKGAGSVSSQNVIKGIKGSNRDIQDPIESIVENTYKIVGLGKRQEVAKTIVSLKDTLPKGMIQKLPKGFKAGVRNTISLFENGKVQRYQVPTEVAEAAKGLSEEQLSTLVKILQAPTSVFRASATGINPEFMIPNVTRDLQSAFVNNGLNPLRWIRGIAHMARKDELYQEFLKSGGKTSRISIDRPMLKKTVAEITNPSGLSVKKPSDLLKILQRMGEYSEQPTRVASFENTLNKLVKQGLSREEALKRAAYASQEGTVNFARRGSKTQSINAVYAFVNARLQGTDRIIRSIKKDPAGAGIRLGLVALAPAMALRQWNKNFESYNDDRILSERDKRDNFIFMLSDTPIEKLGGAQYIKIPKGDVGKLSNPVDAFLNYAEGKGGDVSKAIGETIKSFLPIDEPGGLIPTALKPPVETAVNKNFYTGYDIVPDYKKNYPAGYQDSPYTSPLFRMIGQKTNVSPAKLQHLVEGYGTGLARIGEMATQPFIPAQYRTAKNEQGATINRTPVVRRLLGGAKMSEEEKLKSNAGKYKAITSEIGAIRNAAGRGEIPFESAEAQIKKLQKELPPLGSLTPKQTINDEDIEMIRLRMKTGNLPAVHQEGNYVFYTRESDGSIQKIDMSWNPTKPTLTGQAALDKKLMSAYKGEITSKKNDIVKLYELGAITAEQAEAEIARISATTGTGKAPKKVAIKKYTPTRVKIAKSKTFKAKALPKPRKTKSGYKILVYTDKTPTIKIAKPTVRWS